MEFSSLPEALKLIMKERGWSQVRLARELGKSQEWVSKVSHGERDTPIGQLGRMLADIGWEVVIRPKGEKSGPVKRREFHDKIVKLAGVAVAGRAAGVNFVPSPRTTPYHDPAYVRLLAERAARVQDETGGASEAAWAISQAKRIGAACAGGGRDLHVAASWYTRRTSHILWTAGRNDVAERLAASSLAHAVKGDDLDLQAAARATLSWISRIKGNNELAVAHAQRGLRLPELNDENRAWLNAHLGVALSRIHEQERKSRAALDKALSIDNLPAIDRADIMGVVGGGLHNTGSSQNALATLGEAVHLSASESIIIEASYLGDQALVALDVKRPSEAAGLISRLSYLYPMTDSRRIDDRIRRILQSSARWSHASEVREAREQLTAVVST